MSSAEAQASEEFKALSDEMVENTKAALSKGHEEFDKLCEKSAEEILELEISRLPLKADVRMLSLLEMRAEVDKCASVANVDAFQELKCKWTCDFFDEGSFRCCAAFADQAARDEARKSSPGHCTANRQAALKRVREEAKQAAEQIRKKVAKPQSVTAAVIGADLSTVPAVLEVQVLQNVCWAQLSRQ